MIDPYYILQLTILVDSILYMLTPLTQAIVTRRSQTFFLHFPPSAKKIKFINHPDIMGVRVSYAVINHLNMVKDMIIEFWRSAQIKCYCLSGLLTIASIYTNSQALPSSFYLSCISIKEFGWPDIFATQYSGILYNNRAEANRERKREGQTMMQ